MVSPIKIVGIGVDKIYGGEPGYHFSIAFDRVPDFTTLQAGRPQDAFQVFIAFDPKCPDPSSPRYADVIFRGTEIHIENYLRIRDARPEVSDPDAGGWGRIRGQVPFHLTVHRRVYAGGEEIGGAAIDFRVPDSMLGTSAPFSWGVQSTYFGAGGEVVLQGVWP